jgi:hypothetical protein
MSTRGLSLPVAEVVRSGYIVLAAMLGHLAFGTRPRPLELLGLGVGMGGLAVFAAMGGERGAGDVPSALAWQMGVILIGAVMASLASERFFGRWRVVGVVDAVLAGAAFATLDMAVRTLPDSFSPVEILRFGPAWVGALAAPVGLWLFSRSTARESVAVATSLMVFVNTAGASAWSVAVLGDRVGGSPVVVGLAVSALVAGALMVVAGSPGRVPSEPPSGGRTAEVDPAPGRGWSAT